MIIFSSYVKLPEGNYSFLLPIPIRRAPMIPWCPRLCWHVWLTSVKWMNDLFIPCWWLHRWFISIPKMMIPIELHICLGPSPQCLKNQWIFHLWPHQNQSNRNETSSNPKKNLVFFDPLKSNTSLPNHEASPWPQAVVGATSTAAPWKAWPSAAPA